MACLVSKVGSCEKQKKMPTYIRDRQHEAWKAVCPIRAHHVIKIDFACFLDDRKNCPTYHFFPSGKNIHL